MAKKNYNQLVTNATALVDAALISQSCAIVNSLRNELKKEAMFMKPMKEITSYNKMLGQIERLPEYKSASQKYSYTQWTTFQLWIARTLANKGMEVNLSKHVLETFYRVAGKEEQREMTELLSK